MDIGIQIIKAVLAITLWTEYNQWGTIYDFMIISHIMNVFSKVSVFFACFVFDDIYRRGLIWHLSQSSIRLSNYFSLIAKSRTNPFLEPVLSNKGKKKFAQGNNGGLWWGSNSRPPHYESDVQPTAPHCPLNLIILDWKKGQCSILK